MNENSTFKASNIKNRCRACLQPAEKLFPMKTLEINAYRNLTEKVSKEEDDSNMCLCSICKWLLNKCMKFSRQCQKADMVLTQAALQDSLNQTPMLNLRISNLEVCYVGPNLPECEDGVKNDMMALQDTVDDYDDDDELPLVMLQDDCKSEMKKASDFETNPETEIKIELEIKEEYSEDFCPKARSKKKKKEVKEGFSSRMVQETDEYEVIKLTKKQVSSELAEKAKSELYLRSPYKCEKCVKGFNFEEVLSTHMVKHSREHGSYQCDICTQYCPSQVSLRGHLKSHTTRYKCKLCGQIRLSRQNLLEHHSITHTAAPTEYTCDNCDFTSNKRTVIQRHVRTHAQLERHACHRCGKLFSTVESLRVHTMRHDKTKRLKCPQCDKRFIYQSLLHTHIQAVHERKEYYCVECDVRFKSPESLRLHFKKAKKHRDPSTYKHECPQCPQRFASSSSLSVHLTCAHGASKKHSCEVCGRLYSSREALRAHVWRVHTHRGTGSVCGA